MAHVSLKASTGDSRELVCVDGEEKSALPSIPAWLYNEESSLAYLRYRETHYFAPAMGNFSGLAHVQMRRAFLFFEFVLLATFTISLWYPQDSIAIEYGIRLLKLVTNIVLLATQISSLSYLIMPWKATVCEDGTLPFRIPLLNDVARCDFGVYVWLCFGFVASAANISFKISAVSTLGFQFQSAHPKLKLMSAIVLILGYVPRLTVLLFSWIASTKVHDENDRALPCCGADAVTQIVDFSVCDQSNVERSETYMCTYAERLGLTDWCTTHYECVHRYSASLGLWFFVSMSQEFPLAQVEAILRNEEEPLSDQLALRVARRAQMILRQAAEVVVPMLILSHVPKVAFQVCHYHVHQKTPYELIVGIGTGFLAYLVTEYLQIKSVLEISRLIYNLEAPRNQDAEEIVQDAREIHEEVQRSRSERLSLTSQQMQDEPSEVEEPKERIELADAMRTIRRYQLAIALSSCTVFLFMTWVFLQVLNDEGVPIPKVIPMFVDTLARVADGMSVQ